MDAYPWKSITGMSSYSPVESQTKILVRCCHNLLPDELWVEIMSRLPVKSLLDCKCVQKSWCHLINTLIHDQRFVTRHLKNSGDRPSLFITYSCDVFSSKVKDSLVTICSNENDDVGKIEQMDTVLEDFALSFFRQHYQISFPGSHCNGIICISGLPENTNVLLCNPALREFKLITSSCFGPSIRRNRKRLLGFGHDEVDNVYKVVRMFYENGDLLGAEVHTVGVDHRNSWRRINIEAEELWTDCNRVMYQELQCKRIIYWLASGYCTVYRRIVSFDVHDEKFQLISLPALDDNFATTETCLQVRYKLALWNELVALFEFYLPRCRCGKRSTCFSPKPIEMWILDVSLAGSDHTSYSWTKHLTIPPLGQIYHPVVFWKNDELILMSYSYSTECPGKVSASSYNLGTQKVRSLHNIPETLERISSFTYVQSLVSIS
ncbi:F-box domain containing protein [Parasponia andersonii]|uniref:F-box domain containing protein n=1 Tax=Parasponia andersonii TaxID=3476 RepID=A0A2P5CQH2_PARAD|nr:F-box domain containing protein [Parasponia andersonii]